MGANKNTTPAAEAAADVNAKEKVNQNPVVETETAENATAETATAETATAETAAAETAAAETATAENATAETAAAETHEAELIPSGRFIAENGDEYEFAVKEFTFKGTKYTKEEALSDHTDVLEHLISVNSFILKKV